MKRRDKEQAVQQKDQVLQKYEMKRRDKEQAVQQKDQVLQKYEMERRDKEQTVQQKDQVLQKYEMKRRDKEQAVQQKDQVLQKYEMERRDKEQAVQQKDQVLQKYEMKRRDKEQAVQQKDQVLQKYEMERREKEQTVQQKDQVLQKYEMERRDKEQAVQQKDQVLQKYEMERREKEQTVQQKDQVLQERTNGSGANSAQKGPNIGEEAGRTAANTGGNCHLEIWERLAVRNFKLKWGEWGTKTRIAYVNFDWSVFCSRHCLCFLVLIMGVHRALCLPLLFLSEWVFVFFWNGETIRDEQRWKWSSRLRVRRQRCSICVVTMRYWQVQPGWLSHLVQHLVHWALPTIERNMWWGLMGPLEMFPSKQNWVHGDSGDIYCIYIIYIYI